MPRSRRSLPLRLLLAAMSLLVTLGLAEIALRLLPQRGPVGDIFYQDAERHETKDLAAAMARGMVELLHPPEQSPRLRGRFAPGMRGYICYRDQDKLRRPWLDEQGCVPVAISRWGIREREEIGPDKPPGQRRIVCIGDSFTFAWGVPVEAGWVRLLERDLRRTGQDIVTVNCGAAGAIVVDEYWHALRTRFHVFQPDAVVVGICLNDLLPCNGLCVIWPGPAPTGIALVDRVRALWHDPLAVPPDVDLVGHLLALPQQEGERNRLYNDDIPFAAMWSQQAPQHALIAMRDWCRERQVPFAVVLWPFLQGLGPGEHYPFTRMHELVVAFCAANGVPCLDLLPTLRGRVPAAELWVTPADMHPNPRAHELAAEAVSPFIKDHCRF